MLPFVPMSSAAHPVKDLPRLQTLKRQTMKLLLKTSRHFAAMALLALAAGCAYNGQNNDNLAVAAGFKVITPQKPDHQAVLATLPKDKVSPVNYRGANYYVLPDAKNNVAYVGGAKQYQTYQQLRTQQKMSNDAFEAKQLDTLDNHDWGGWGGGVAAFTPLP